MGDNLLRKGMLIVSKKAAAPVRELVRFPVGELALFHKNARVGDVAAIAESLRVRGQYKPVVVNLGTLTGRPLEVLAGNHTVKAAASLGWAEVEAVTVDVDEKAAAGIVAADNRLADLGSYDEETLRDLLGVAGLEATGYTQADYDAMFAPASTATNLTGSLAARFGAPPLSVLSARGGEWQERKRAWLATGMRSELGRAADLVFDSPQTKYKNWYPVKASLEAQVGHALSADEVLRKGADRLELAAAGEGTSVFDPALAELLYQWFSAPGARVIDPWAGGAVRGVVAASLGREYVGVELRPEQIAANEAQLPAIKAAVDQALGAGGGSASWLQGDPVAALEAWADESFDLVFSEPPVPAVDGPLGVDDLTPVEEHGGFRVKRDDAYGVGSSRGGKVRSCWTIAVAAKSAGKTKLVTAGSRQSPQVNIVAEVAAALGMGAEVHVPSGAMTPELLAARESGAEVVQHQYGRNSVIVSRARKAAEADPLAVEVPFGMETPLAVELTAAQVANVPADVKRIVMPVGSGMSLAGVLHGLARSGRSIPVLGVVVGSDPAKRLDKYAPEGWRGMVDLVPAGLDYHDHAPTNVLGELVLDPVYEAKALRFLEPGDLLWVVGIRGSLVAGEAREMGPLPEWVEGESREALSAMDGDQFDLALGCPPYYSLERYSDDPRDLSTMSPAEFDAAMVANIAEVARVLREDSFAVFVVGNVRARDGSVLDMRRCMSAAAEAAGMRLVSDAVLLSPVGTAAARAARQFEGTRSVARVHQEVLVYCKGDRKRAAVRAGALDPNATRTVEVSDE